MSNHLRKVVLGYHVTEQITCLELLKCIEQSLALSQQNSRRSQSHLLPRRNQSPSHHPHALTPHINLSLKMGNGAKAQQKRERNAKDTSTKGSQLKAVRNQEKRRRRRRQSLDVGEALTD